MADRILKPDSGNDLVLQNDDGSGKIEINENASIPVTGTLDVSGATLTTSSAQKQAIVDGASIEAQDLASGSGTSLPNNVQDAITRLGAVTSGSLGSSVGFPAGGTGNPISVAVICDEKAANTSGGSSASFNGSWATKDLNTELSDPDNIVSIASNQFTLNAGTYLITFSSPMYVTDRHQSRLYDVTGSAVLVSGSSEYSVNNTAVSTRSMGSKMHTITSNNVYEIQHQCDFTRSDGLGVGSNMGITSIFTLVTIYKLK